MNVIDSINNRRSIRKYTDEKISKDTLKELITLGTKAATASNEQPWGFLILDDKEEINRYSEEIKAYLSEHLEENPGLKRYAKWLPLPKFHVFNGTNTVLVIYGNSNSVWSVYDCTLAAGNIMLAAESMNIGTCWIGFAHSYFNTKEFKEAHNIPLDFNLVSPLSMGYKSEELPSATRKEPLIF